MRAGDFEYFDEPIAALAHRGGATYPANLGRENTLHAFTEAVALGFRYLETDVHTTSDGVLVAFHDDKLDRVTDLSGRVGAIPYAQLRRARIHGLDHIPTLAELFQAFPDARFNIDAKSEGSIGRLAQEIIDHSAQARVCVSSFGRGRLHRLRRLLGPGVASAASPLGVAVNRFFPWLTAALNTSAPVLQLPVDRRAFGLRLQVLTDGLIDAVHGAGKRVHVWTIDDPDEMRLLLDAGVDGIFTDRIDVLKDVLIARGQWTGVP